LQGYKILHTISYIISLQIYYRSNKPVKCDKLEGTSKERIIIGHRVHRPGHISKNELMDGRTGVLSTILEASEDDQCLSKHVLCIHN
jgi:hypothetical protein